MCIYQSEKISIKAYAILLFIRASTWQAVSFIKNDEEFIDIIVSEYDDYFIFDGDVVRAEMFIEKGDFRRDKFICLDESSDKPLFSGIKFHMEILLI